MENTSGILALARVLARPSIMNNMLDEDIVAVVEEAVNTPVERFFLERITDASVNAEKSALAQLALINRKNNAKAA